MRTTPKTPAERKRESRAQLRKDGGGVRSFELLADELAALARIRQANNLPTDASAVVWALQYADQAIQRPNG